MRAQCTRGCYTRWKEEWFTRREAGCWYTVKERRARKAAPPPLAPPLLVVRLVDLGAYHDLPSKRARFLQLTRKNGRCWAYIFIFRGRIGSSRELLKRPKLFSLPPPSPHPPLTSLSLVFIPPPPLIVSRADKTIEQQGPLRPRSSCNFG